MNCYEGIYAMFASRRVVSPSSELQSQALRGLDFQEYVRVEQKSHVCVRLAWIRRCFVFYLH